jgi:hypothetical protein
LLRDECGTSALIETMGRYPKLLESERGCGRHDELASQDETCDDGAIPVRLWGPPNRHTSRLGPDDSHHDLKRPATREDLGTALPSRLRFSSSSVDGRQTNCAVEPFIYGAP